MLNFIRNQKDVVIQEYEGKSTKASFNSERDARLLESTESMLFLLNVSLHYLDRCSAEIEDIDLGEELDDLATRIKKKIQYIEHGFGEANQRIAS